MADQFDAIDVIYGWLNAGKVKAYKDKAPTKPDLESFAVIKCPNESNLQRINRMYITVLIYQKKNPNGMISRSEIKATKDKITQLVKNGNLPGYLFDMAMTNSYLDTEYSKEYDIYVLRYDLRIKAS